LPVLQPADQVAAVVQPDVHVRHGRPAEADAGGVGLVHAQHDVGVLAAGDALGGGTVDVAGQGQVVGDPPSRVGAVQVGVHDAMRGLVQHLRIEAHLRVRVVHGEAGDD